MFLERIFEVHSGEERDHDSLKAIAVENRCGTIAWRNTVSPADPSCASC